MKTNNDVGGRLLVTEIDRLATDPLRVWASVPVDDGDLSKGFHDVTYASFANAINRTASWLSQHLPPPKQPFETVAYSGSTDICYPILTLAVAKIGRKLLLPSPFASVNAQAHMVQSSACRVFIHDKHRAGFVDQILSKVADNSVSTLQFLEKEDLLNDEVVPPFPFDKTWEQTKDDPWLLLHTSGTTGFPKLIMYSHKLMATFDAAKLMPDAHEENLLRQIQNRRLYTPLPCLHILGILVALQFPVFLDTVVVIGPANAGPTGPALAQEIIRKGRVQSVMLPPSLIDGLCESSTGLQCLRELNYVYYAGAALSCRTAEKLLGHVPILPAMGSTEAGGYFLLFTGDNDWNSYTFRPGMGMEFQPRTEGLYEAVFVRNPSVERWQQVFQIYPELQTFATGDLFQPIPSKPGSWRFIGRTDDMVTFSHGENLYVGNIESEIQAAAPDIAGVLIGGQGRRTPYVLVDWKDIDSDKQDRLEKLRPVLDKVNQRLSNLVQLKPEIVQFTRPSQPLVRTFKGTISRRESEKLYRDDIEQLYIAVEN